MDSAYQVSHLPCTNKSPITDLPLINPYAEYTKSLQSQNLFIKERVRGTKFDRFDLLLANGDRHIVTLELPKNIRRAWISRGFTHLHFGTVRFALTLHHEIKESLISRIALLDSRFPDYQHACIGTIETTLNVGTILITMFPNFHIPIIDPHRLCALKVQIQIIGPHPSTTIFEASLHCQMVYRIQNHSLNSYFPRGEKDAILLLKVDNNKCVTNCTYVPKQISRQELLKLIPESWIIAYESCHKTANNVKPIQSHFMLQPVESVYVESVPIYGFDSNGNAIYKYKDEGGHVYWDVCSCSQCSRMEDEQDVKRPTRTKKNSKQRELQEVYENGDREVGLLGEPSGKFDYYVKYTKPSTNTSGISQGWDDDDNGNGPRSWKIKNRKTKISNSSTYQIRPAKVVSKWRPKNAAVAHNLVRQIEQK